MSSLKQSVSLIFQPLLVLVFFLFNMKPPMITWYNMSSFLLLFWHSYFYIFSERFTIGKNMFYLMVKRIASCLKWHHLDYDLVLRQCVCVCVCVCALTGVCAYECVWFSAAKSQCLGMCSGHVHYFDHMHLPWQMGCGEESNCWTWRPSLTELWTYARKGTRNCFFFPSGCNTTAAHHSLFSFVDWWMD